MSIGDLLPPCFPSSHTFSQSSAPLYMGKAFLSICRVVMSQPQLNCAVCYDYTSLPADILFFLKLSKCCLCFLFVCLFFHLLGCLHTSYSSTSNSYLDGEASLPPGPGHIPLHCFHLGWVSSCSSCVQPLSWGLFPGRNIPSWPPVLGWLLLLTLPLHPLVLFPSLLVDPICDGAT